MLLCFPSGQQNSACTSPLESELNGTAEFEYLSTTGVTVLFPDLQFNCTGYVQSIGSLVFQQETQTTAHYFQIQIWRPSSETNYTLIAAETINDITPSSNVADNIKIYNKNYTSSTKLYFRKNDVIGMYIPNSNSAVMPLIPVFLRNPNDEDTRTRMHWLRTTFVPCQISLCSSTVRDVVLQTRFTGRSSCSVSTCVLYTSSYS